MPRLLVFSLAILLALPGLSPLIAAEINDLESQFEQDADASGDADNLEWLLFLEQHPLDLNRATTSELSDLPYLSSEEASAIVAYRNKNGRFESVEDLLHVKGLDPERVRLFKRYLTEKSHNPPEFNAETTLRIKRKTPDPLGFTTPNDSSRYLGNDLAVRSRTLISYEETLRLLLGTFKDAGEKNYADAVVLGAEGKTARTDLVLGHYVIGFAQGLAFGQIHGYSRFSGKLLPYAQSPDALRLYQGSAPGNAFLGGAGQATFGKFNLWMFASRQNLDATIDPITGDVLTNLKEGEHRSLNEMAKQDVLREEMAGGRISYDSGGKLTLGATGYSSKDNPAISPQWNERRVYDFRGARNSVLAADAALSLGPGQVFVEAAQSYGGGNAGTVGGVWSALPWAFSLTAWHYDPDFHNEFANGPCYVEPNNENGALLMGKANLASKTLLSGYYEEYHHPWRRYYEAFPTEGYEYGGEVRQPLGRSFEFSLRRKVCQGEGNVTGVDGASLLDPSNRYLTRYEALWHITLLTSLRLRFEQARSVTGGQASQGTNLGLTLGQRLGRTWHLSSSIAVFHTDSYDSRIYQWEEDLPGIMTNSALYGRGRKATLYLEGRLFQSVTCSLKYSAAYYYNQTAVGSGLDCRPGNIVQEMGFGLTARNLP